MLKAIFLGVLIAASAAFSASAADLNAPTILQGSGVAPAYSWTGFYVGAHGGYDAGRWNGDLTYSKGASGFTGNHTVQASGISGGAQLGYNYQVGKIVYGFEADITGGDLDGHSGFASGGFDKTFAAKMDYYGTARARIGYAVGNLLPYVTGGFAWGHTSVDNKVFNMSLASMSPDHSGLSGTGSADEMHVGWTAGAGVEWALSSTWSVKAEWLYTDLGRQDYRIDGSVVAPFGSGRFNTDGFKSDLTFNEVKIGVNYKLGSGFIPLK